METIKMKFKDAPAVLSKTEAIYAMKAGMKVRHEYFSSDEWMMMKDTGEYKFEDGVVCDPILFWMDRSSPQWLTGWSIV